jgi:WD40 repeat protein
VRFHPHDDTLLSCSYDDTVKVWEDDEAGDWHCATTLTAHKSTVRHGTGSLGARCRPPLDQFRQRRVASSQGLVHGVKRLALPSAASALTGVGRCF